MRRRKRRRKTTMTTMTATTTMMMTAPGSHCLIAHIMIWMSFPEKNQTPIGNDIGGEVATSQATEQLVSPTNLNSSHRNDNCKNDYHKYDADLPVAKLDPFTMSKNA